MKTFFRNKWLVFVANMFIILVSFLLFSPTYTWVNYINTCFYIAFIYMMIWLVLVVIRGGFFNGIAFGFRRFRIIASKNPDFLEEMEEKPDLSERINKRFYQQIRFHAWILLAWLLLLLLVYYV
ncbi:MAG TPA: DUF3899 domain-containing protein [Bacillota bacterium]|nr:DUF3899 domain-containing protein [Bacillota bacterium]